jgi:hypothetical protein
MSPRLCLESSREPQVLDGAIAVAARVGFENYIWVAGNAKAYIQEATGAKATILWGSDAANDTIHVSRTVSTMYFPGVLRLGER